jgi:hypothetical protein
MLPAPPFFALFDSHATDGRHRIIGKEYTRTISEYSKSYLGSGGWAAWKEFLIPVPKNVNKPSAIRFLDAIEVLSSALVATHAQESFLRLWAVLEILSNAEKGNTDLVATRTAHLFPDPTVAKPRLTALATMRNVLVHEGRWIGEGITGRDLLMSLVAHAIVRYRALSMQLPDATEVDQFFELALLSQSTLRSRKRVFQELDSIKKQLSQPTPRVY